MIRSHNGWFKPQAPPNPKKKKKDTKNSIRAHQAEHAAVSASSMYSTTIVDFLGLSYPRGAANNTRLGSKHPHTLSSSLAFPAASGLVGIAIQGKPTTDSRTLVFP